MSFSGDISRFTKAAEKKANRVFRGTALSLFSKVILRTPVDTGRLRGNWSFGIGSAPDGISASTDKTGSQAQGKLLTSAGKLRLGQSIYMINNLPYAQAVEHGSSNQAPAGMVKVTIRIFQRLVKQQARK